MGLHTNLWTLTRLRCNEVSRYNYKNNITPGLKAIYYFCNYIRYIWVVLTRLFVGRCGHTNLS